MRNLFTWSLLLLLTFTSQAQQLSDPLKVDNKTFDLLQNLSKSQIASGEIYLFTTTHQDIGWLEQPEVCIINRDTLWLTPFMERLATDPLFKMDIEQTSIVMEYIHRYPEKKELINQYIKAGRICVGATFMQPYEEMYSGEALARQFYFGNRWLKKNFDGYKPSSYFNVDVPGRTLQMPQIMQKAGVDNLIISRHERGLFYWEAPDGSKVRTYTPGHYIYFYNVLGKNDTAAIKELAQESVLWYTKYNDVPKSKTVMPAMLNYEFIWDQKPVENCVPFTTLWNNLKTIQNENGTKAKVKLPKFKYAIADDFFSTLDKSTSKLPIIKGERPNVWIYIHGPSHERALTASRAGDWMLPDAEKINSFDALAAGHWNNYPEAQLQEAWKAKIYPDHGWGGKNGVITDNLFLNKYTFALSEAKNMVQSGLRNLASQINTGLQAGRSLVVFNSLSWERTDPVQTALTFEPGFAKQISVNTSDTKEIPSQLSQVTRYPDGSIHTAQLHFVATVPAMGYQTYAIQTSLSTTKTSNTLTNNLINNRYYTIELVDGGIKQITDKELGIEMLDASKFLGGEIITMQSVGNGAGEFDAVQKPTMEGFDKVSHHQPQWKLVEDGPVFTTFSYRSTIRNAVVVQSLRVYHEVKKMDFDVSLLNWEGILYREYRLMLPINMSDGKVSYEVPYGVLTVGDDEMLGAAGERYYEKNSEQHPRGIGNWISASNSSFGVTLSSSVAVADYIDPTTNPVSNTILQPVLLASRKSCHWEGNEYLQHGDHHYHFSLTSHPSGWSNGHRFGVAANQPLQAVYQPQAYKTANLPSSNSFFSVGNSNIIVSTIKKCEDDNSLIVRLYNIGNTKEKVRFTSSHPPKSIVKVNLIEEEQEVVKEMVLDKYAIETYKLKY